MFGDATMREFDSHSPVPEVDAPAFTGRVLVVTCSTGGRS